MYRFFGCAIIIKGWACRGRRKAYAVLEGLLTHRTNSSESVLSIGHGLLAGWLAG